MSSASNTGTPVEPLERGTILAGRYVIKRRKGAGGMGVVYEASDRQLGDRPVAIKTVHERTDESLTRFRAEAALAAQIQSPYIITVHDFWTAQDGVPYMAMELLVGRSLKELLAGQPMVPTRAVFLLLGVCQAVCQAHACGICHRDLSDGNIFVVESHGDESVKVIDFGLSTSSHTSRVTAPGQVRGTPSYIAPERLDGAEGDALSDQYSLAAVLYQALTGRRPFSEDLRMPDVVMAIANGDFPRADKVVSTIDSSLADVVARAMALDPADRFPSVHQLGRALLPFADDHGRAVHRKFFENPPPVPKLTEQLTGPTTLVQKIVRTKDAVSDIHKAPTVQHEYDHAAHEAVTVEHTNLAQEAATVPHDYGVMFARVKARRAASAAERERAVEGEQAGQGGIEAAAQGDATTGEAAAPGSEGAVESSWSKLATQGSGTGPVAPPAPRQSRSRLVFAAGAAVAVALGVAGYAVVGGQGREAAGPKLTLPTPAGPSTAGETSKTTNTPGPVAPQPPGSVTALPTSTRASETEANGADQAATVVDSEVKKVSPDVEKAPAPRVPPGPKKQRLTVKGGKKVEKPGAGKRPQGAASGVKTAPVKLDENGLPILGL